MGSACHQRGVYHLLPKLQALIRQYNLEDRLKLKGSFCLGPCTYGIVMQFGGEIIVNVTADNIEQKLREEILPYLVDEEV
ncbi:MAG: (2Fe-2S) ferredoxin domain-containing protein [Chloroflexi bacterium]|nr:MAG: (2Fe-2S) ferredoxin domain-containing protein [Chloroflexota bacterium]